MFFLESINKKTKVFGETIGASITERNDLNAIVDPSELIIDGVAFAIRIKTVNFRVSEFQSFGGFVVDVEFTKFESFSVGFLKN